MTLYMLRTLFIKYYFFEWYTYKSK